MGPAGSGRSLKGIPMTIQPMFILTVPAHLRFSNRLHKHVSDHVFTHKEVTGLSTLGILTKSHGIGAIRSAKQGLLAHTMRKCQTG